METLNDFNNRKKNILPEMFLLKLISDLYSQFDVPLMVDTETFFVKVFLIIKRQISVLVKCVILK